MRSDAFDTYLEVYQGSDTGEAIATDDDGLGEDTNSRLRFSARRTAPTSCAPAP